MAHTYCISDLHGCYAIWKEIEKFLNPEDILYCLGDNIDRGAKGIHIFEEMLKRDNTTILMGNHEEMCIQEYDPDYPPYDGIWFMNGGGATYHELEYMSTDRANTIIQCMKKLPYFVTYTNTKGQLIFLHHAGFDPEWRGTDFRHCNNKPFTDVWNRGHLMWAWPPEDDICWKNPLIKDYKNAIIVHGHTPVQTLNYFGAYKMDKDTSFMDDNPKVKPEMITYCNGHKIDIDMGAVQSGYTCLLDLDTLQPRYFCTD